MLHGPDGEVETVVDYQAGEATGAVQSSPRGRCGRGLGCLRIAAVSLLSLLHAHRQRRGRRMVRCTCSSLSDEHPSRADARSIGKTCFWLHELYENQPQQWMRIGRQQ